MNGFKWKWLLHSSIPSAARAIQIDQVQEQSISSQVLQNENNIFTINDESTVKNNTYQKRQNTSEIVEDITSKFERKMSNLESKISDLKKIMSLYWWCYKSQKDNLSMKDTQLKSVEYLKLQKKLNNIWSKLPLNKMLEKVIFDQYHDRETHNKRKQ